MSLQRIGIRIERTNLAEFFHVWHPKADWRQTIDGLVIKDPPKEEVKQ